MDVRTLTESENFIVFKFVPENGKSKKESLDYVLSFMEKLKARGFLGLHYIPFSEAFVCQKLNNKEEGKD